MAWVEIDRSLAEEHPLYGVKGWAAFLLFYLLFRAVIAYLFAYSPDPISALVIVAIVWLLLASFLLIARRMSFQIVLTVYLIFHLIIVTLTGADKFTGKLPTITTISEATSVGYMHALVGYVALNLMLLSYIWISRRINVTCRSLVRSNDPILSEEESFSEDMKTLILAFIILGGLAFLIFLASNSPS